MIIYTKRRPEVVRDLCIFTRQLYPGFQVHKPSTSSHAIMFGPICRLIDFICNCSPSASMLPLLLFPLRLWYAGSHVIWYLLISSDIFWYLLISADICASCTIAHIKIIKISSWSCWSWTFERPLAKACILRKGQLFAPKEVLLDVLPLSAVYLGWISGPCLLKTFTIFRLRIFDQIFWGWLYTLNISE
jgi:hypothetical protein